MASVYTRLFGSQHVTLAVAGTVPVATAPAGLTWIVRDLVLANPTQALAQFHLFYNLPGGAVYLALIDVPVTSSVHYDLRQVVPPGATIQIFSTSLDYSYTITGYELGVSPSP